MTMIHVVEGPVGAGKTTFANQLGKKYRTPPLVLDDWMVTLFSPDRPDDEIWSWYAVRKERCMDQIWKIASGLLQSGNQGIVELGLLRCEDRHRFFHRAEEAGYACRLYVLDVPIDERWRRVQKRNLERGETFAMKVSQDVFTMASQMWEPPNEEERARYDIEFV